MIVSRRLWPLFPELDEASWVYRAASFLFLLHLRGEAEGLVDVVGASGDRTVGDTF